MVCDWWDCEKHEECKQHLLFSGAKYPPCAVCVHFDKCDFCSHFSECSRLVTRYLPNMFRRLVREIRNGEETDSTEQYIKRNTCKGRKNPTKSKKP